MSKKLTKSKLCNMRNSNTKPRIYKATSMTTGLSYIGQTKYSLAHRVRQHYNRAFSKLRQTRFAKALREIGFEDFEWQTLQEIDIKNKTFQEVQDELNELEKFYIKKFNSFEEGYNMDEGGSGSLKGKYLTWGEKYAANRANHIRRRRENKEAHNKDQLARKKALYEKHPEKKIHNAKKHKELMKVRQQTSEYKIKHHLAMKRYRAKLKAKSQSENKNDSLDK